MLKIAIFAMIRLVKHNSYIKSIDEMFLKCLTRAHTGDRLKAEVKIMKRLALPIILILALVLVTAFGCVQDENVSETPPGGGHDFSTWSDGLHTFVLNIFGAESDA